MCNASPAADSVPAMIAAGAVVAIVGPEGRGECRFEDIVSGSGQTLPPSARETSWCRSCCRNVRRGRETAICASSRVPGMDIAVVGAGINLTFDAAGVCTDARVSIGAVAERALLVHEGTAALIGSTIDEHALSAWRPPVSAACCPVETNAEPRNTGSKIVGVMARRATHIALHRAQRTN